MALGAVGLVATAAVQLSGVGPTDRRSALVGVATAWATGLGALLLKRWALTRSLRAVLGAAGGIFGVRLLLLAAAIWFLSSKRLGVLAFTAGFFGVYFVLQWLEIAYVSLAMKHWNREGRIFYG